MKSRNVGSSNRMRSLLFVELLNVAVAGMHAVTVSITRSMNALFAPIPKNVR